MSEYLEKYHQDAMLSFKINFFERLHREALPDVGAKPPDVEVEPEEPSGMQRTVSM